MNVNIFIYKNYLFFVGNLGIMYLQVFSLLNILEIYCNKNTFLSKTLYNDYITLMVKNIFFLRIKKIIDDFYRIIKNKLLLFGIGFRCWSFTNFINLKLGFSNDNSIAIPCYIKFICLKSSLLLLKSCDSVKLNKFLILLRKLRVPDIYKGKGLLYVNEKICLKRGKHN